jgi:hypothetical protein
MPQPDGRIMLRGGITCMDEQNGERERRMRRALKPRVHREGLNVKRKVIAPHATTETRRVGCASLSMVSRVRDHTVYFVRTAARGLGCWP